MAVYHGTSGNDHIEGTAGNDRFYWSGGMDTYDADDGFNTLDVSGGTAAAFFSIFYDTSIYGGVSFYATVSDGSNNVIYAHNFDRIIFTDFDDRFLIDTDETFDSDFTIIAGDGDDIVRTNDGDDTISGGKGEDQLLGENGEDYLTGGEGFDQMAGGDGADTLFGQRGDDIIYGDSEYDPAFTAKFSDQLYGGQGRDELYFDELDSVVLGGGGWDIGIASPNAASIALNLLTSSIEEVYGSDFADHFDATGKGTIVKIYGGDGDDTITGGGGSDRLYGEGGNDTLTGNGANDRFYFESDWGQDIVTDYDANGNNDRLDVSAAGITSFSEFTESTNGTDTILTLNVDPNQTITLLNTDPNTINQWDFIFCIGSCDQMDDSMIFSDQDRPDIPKFDFAELSTPASESEAILDELDMFGLSSSVLSPFQTDVFDASDMGLWDMF